MHRALLPALLSALALAACASPSVTSDFDPESDFASFRTFAFLEPDPFIAAPTGARDVVLEGIVAATRDDLTSKGLTLAEETEDADLVVSFSLGARERVEVNEYPAYFERNEYGDGTADWGYPYVGQVGVHAFREGTLAIDMVNPEHGRPVWHGRTQGTITERMARDPEKTVRDAVNAILERFPPGHSRDGS
ncbi:MAG: DUF4136 domain-containing protein [Planctomycetota bacterium]